MNHRNLLGLVSIAFALTTAVAQAQTYLANDLVETRVQELMRQHSVQGLAMAIVDDGKIDHVAAFGWRNAEKKLPLTVDTVMYGASLTKTAFAYMLLQLVDEGKLDLDTPMEKLLPHPLPQYEEFADLADDLRWHQLTPRILLTHTSGFANFRWLESDKRLRFHHDPGTRYGYSGEGFYILQLIVEEGLKLDVGAEMQKRIFDRFDMKNTSMLWRADFANNLADGYKHDGAMQPHDERSSPSAAGSMDTTIADQAKMWSGIISGKGLTAASRQELVRPQFPITSIHQFPTLNRQTNPRNADIELSAGLGLVTFRDKKGAAWFKGGHNDWTGNMVVCLESEKRCVVLLSNDVRAEKIYPEVVSVALGTTNVPWHWEYDWYVAPNSQ